MYERVVTKFHFENVNPTISPKHDWAGFLIALFFWNTYLSLNMHRIEKVSENDYPDKLFVLALFF
jgi:CDP-diglyceride synthetase